MWEVVKIKKYLLLQKIKYTKPKKENEKLLEKENIERKYIGRNLKLRLLDESCEEKIKRYLTCKKFNF